MTRARRHDLFGGPRSAPDTPQSQWSRSSPPLCRCSCRRGNLRQVRGWGRAQDRSWERSAFRFVKCAGCMTHTAFAMCHAVSHQSIRNRHAPGHAESVHARGVVACQLTSSSGHDTCLRVSGSGQGGVSACTCGERSSVPSCGSSALRGCRVHVCLDPDSAQLPHLWLGCPYGSLALLLNYCHAGPESAAPRGEHKLSKLNELNQQRQSHIQPSRAESHVCELLCLRITASAAPSRI